MYNFNHSPTGLLVPAILLFCVPVTTLAQCTLSLDINSMLSKWNITTRVEWNTDTFIVGEPGAADIGVQGRMFVLTDAVCPTTVATALDVLEGATFSGLDATEMVSIRMWPPAIQSTVPGVGRIDMRSVEWELSSEEITGLTMEDAPVDGVMLQTKLAGLTSTLTGGIAVSRGNSTGGGTVSYRQLPTLPTPTDVNLTITRKSANELRFTMQNVQMPLFLDASFGDRTVPVDVILRGDIVADTVIGCVLFCGQRGTCKLKNGQPTCVCDCGWTGIGCNTALGFCPVPNSYSLPGNTSSIRSADLEALADRGVLRTCAREDPATGECTECLDGYRGFTCNLCSTDRGCQGLRPDLTNPTCDQALEYSVDTLEKTYSCDVSKITGLGDLLFPELLFRCNTSSIAGREPIVVGPVDGEVQGPSVNVSALADELPGTPEASGGTCELSFTVLTAASQPVYCLTWGCVFLDGASQVRCARVKCDCPNPKGCPEPLDTILPTLSRTVDVDCGDKPGFDEPYCTIDIENLFLTLEAPCIASECRGNSSAGSTVSVDRSLFDTPAQTNWNVVLSGIPLYFAGGLAFLILLLTIPRMIAVQSAVSTVRKHKSVGVSTSGWAGSGAVERKTFSFSSICLEAPPPQATCMPKRGDMDNVELDDLESPPGPVQESTESGSGPHFTIPSEAAIPSPGSRHESMQSAGRPDNGRWNAERSSNGIQNVKRSADDDVYASKVPKPDKPYILYNVSGSVHSGEILAIMGPSGAGKSSLLSILSQQPQLLPKKTTPTGKVGITPMYAGGTVTPEASVESTSEEHPPAHPFPSPYEGPTIEFLDVSQKQEKSSDASLDDGAELGFVQQHDCLLPTLTVTETVLLGMMFREHVKGKQVEEAGKFVYALLKDLGLLGCAHRLVGGSSGVVGVSGGERRRVSIALELCARPRVLLMDEVTSGLDSHTAHKLVTMLKRIARDHNRIMITAIHQPSQAIFNKMDRLLLLAGGRAVFSGPSDEVDGMLTNARVPRTAEMPMADFLLDLVNEPVQMKAVQQYSARTVDGRGLDLGQDAGNWVHQKLKSRKAPLLYRLGILVWRSLLDVSRNWSMLLMTCTVALIFGVFVGLVFWNLETDIAGVQNRAGSIFFTLVFLDLLAVTSIDSLLNERAVIRKEVRLGYYPAFMYMIAKTLVDSILLRAVPALLFGVPVYFMAKLSATGAKTMMFMFILVTFAIATQLQAMVIVEFSKRAGTATVVFVMVLVISMLFGGFLVNADSTHPGVAWVQYLSLIFYAFEAMAVNEFKESSFDLAVDGLGSIENVDGEIIAETLGINMGKLRRDIILLVVWAASLFLILLVSPTFRSLFSRR